MIVTTHGLINRERTSLDYIPNSGMRYAMHSYYSAPYSTIYNPGTPCPTPYCASTLNCLVRQLKKLLGRKKNETFSSSSATKVINELETLLVRAMRTSGAIK